MASNRISPNQREILSAQSTVTGKQEYLLSTNGALNTTGGGGGGGGNGAIEDGVTPTILATVADLANSNPLAVEIVDGTGTQITSFGGGTQYVNGTAQATPTGTVTLGYDGANVRALKTATDGTLKTQLDAAQANTTGSITTASSVVTVTDLTGVGAVTVQISGTYAGVNVTFEASVDGTNFVAIAAQPVASTTPTLVTSTGVLTANSTNVWNVAPLLGIAQFRVRATAYTSGTATVVISPSAQFVQFFSTVNGTSTVNLQSGAGVAIGSGGTGTALTVQIAGANGALGVTQSTTPWVVSGSGSFNVNLNAGGTVGLAAGTNTIGNVSTTASTSASTSVAGSATTVSLLALNTNRRAAAFFNDSTAVLYLKLGATASTTSYTVQIPSNGYYEVPQPCFTGAIDGIWASATGNARITQVTA